MIVFPTSLLFGGLTPLKNMSSSAGMIAFPNEWKVIKHVPNHQPVYIQYIKKRKNHKTSMMCGKQSLTTQGGMFINLLNIELIL
jgi:hypothetical protein